MVLRLSFGKPVVEQQDLMLEVEEDGEECDWVSKQNVYVLGPRILVSTHTCSIVGVSALRGGSGLDALVVDI